MLKYLRYFLTGLAILMASLLGIFIFAFRPFHVKNVNTIAILFKWIGKWIVGLRFHIEGEENHAQNGGSIYISNHQSNYDVFMGCTVNAPNVVSVGKTAIVYYPIFGILYWLSGNILINRSNKKKALESMQKVKRELHEIRRNIWIMPEGTRNKVGSEMLPFKKGAFVTAIQAQVPIIPVAISFYRDSVDLNKWISAHICIKVLPPVSTEGMTMDDRQTLADICREKMEAGIAEMTSKAEREYGQS